MLVTHAGQVCADRSIGRGTAAQRESSPAVLCGDQALLPISAHSIGFCVMRVCISSSSSSEWDAILEDLQVNPLHPGQHLSDFGPLATF